MGCIRFQRIGSPGIRSPHRHRGVHPHRPGRMILQILRDYYPEWDAPGYLNPIGWTKVLCPFHEETRPSATISIDFDVVHCFVCGTRETPLSIVMRMEECTRDEAREILARLADEDSPVLPRSTPRKPRRAIFDRGSGTQPSGDQAIRSRVFRRD